MKQQIKIKINGGKYKGKTLAVPAKDTTRSSKAIVRESVINSLQIELLDTVFVEVFAGSGSVGLEALSRGAAFGIFCEKDKEAYTALISNINTLGIKNTKAFMQDSFLFFNTIKAIASEQKQPCIFYFDPPFDIRDNMSDVYQKTINLISALSKDYAKIAVLEARTGAEIAETAGEFTVYKTKTFGQTTLYYYA